MNAGSYTITPGGLTSSNYTISFVNGTLTIDPKALTVTGITADNKVYDGTTTTTLSGTPLLAGVVGGDTVNLGGTPVANFVDANVGNDKPVNVSGYTIDKALPHF